MVRTRFGRDMRPLGFFHFILAALVCGAFLTSSCPSARGTREGNSARPAESGSGAGTRPRAQGLNPTRRRQSTTGVRQPGAGPGPSHGLSRESSNPSLDTTCTRPSPPLRLDKWKKGTVRDDGQREHRRHPARPVPASTCRRAAQMPMPLPGIVRCLPPCLAPSERALRRAAPRF